MGTKNFLIFGLLFTSQVSLAQNNLSSLTWGINNDGATQQIAIDHYTSGNLVGVKGEDIHLPAPAENGRTVIVGVLDTGIDYNHPQLKNVLAGKGYNAINNTNDASDTHGHGTHISGIIAAELNESGFHGVSKNARILPVKVVQTGPNAPIRPQDTEPGPGTALTENVAKGLVWAIQNGAEVINLSMAWPASIRSKRVDAAMDLAKQKNVIIVSSAGNDSTTGNVYPCIYENVICVGSHGPDGYISHFSNYGSMVDILAPGAAILSSWPMTKSPVTYAGQVGYEFRNGTSMSAPFVTGAAAELLSRGFSPDEVKNRLLMGSRKTAATAIFNSSVQGEYTQNKSTEAKTLRFGNLDVSRAISMAPTSMILPVKKGIYEIEWDGISQILTLPIDWKNRWVAAGATEITIEGQIFSFEGIDSGATVTTPVQISLGDHPESTLHLKGHVKTADYDKDDIEITVQIARVIRSDLIPSNASVQSISGIDPKRYTGMRSVVNADPNGRADLIFTKVSPSGIELALVQGSNYLGSGQIAGFIENQLLNFYRLPDQSYAAIFTKPDKNVTRPNFFIEKFDAKMTFVSETVLGTDTTVLSENFKWVPFKSSFTPLWISVGFTPKLDQPKYDPWNPNYKDAKIPRLFYLDGQNLRTVSIAKDQIPLQILPDGRVLLTSGNSFIQNYVLVTLVDGVIQKTEPLSLDHYRMLVGLESGIPNLDLKGDPSNTILVTGASTSGNLRVTGLGGRTVDSILERSTILDALVSLVGGFADLAHQYFFVQTHYDLQFFTSDSHQTLSTSLNRYSYIPSMIFSRSFYPTVVRDQNGAGLPGVYIPAMAQANGNVSEVIVADPYHERMMRPAKLRMKLKDPNCVGLGNLIAAQVGTAAKQVFICGSNLIQVPLEL